MSEEYARRGGHADLLRESVDGATGEWRWPHRAAAPQLSSRTWYGMPAVS